MTLTFFNASWWNRYKSSPPPAYKPTNKATVGATDRSFIRCPARSVGDRSNDDLIPYREDSHCHWLHITPRVPRIGRKGGDRNNRIRSESLTATSINNQSINHCIFPSRRPSVARLIRSLDSVVHPSMKKQRSTDQSFRWLVIGESSARS